MVKRPAVSQSVRQLVASRANALGEYCLISKADTFLGCHIDHIISVKHGGRTELENLAYACVVCNRHKGSDLGSISQESGKLTQFFDPRTDRWSERFNLEGFFIKGITDVGEVTARILGLNFESQIVEREILIAERRYPSAMASRLMAIQ